MIIFKSFLTTFEANVNFRVSWAGAVLKNQLDSKTKPPLPNLPYPNP
jgi:hypothetical protein